MFRTVAVFLVRTSVGVEAFVVTAGVAVVVDVTTVTTIAFVYFGFALFVVVVEKL